ncbi:hypothetical protein D3C71_1681660 [compost metagenome]
MRDDNALRGDVDRVGGRSRAGVDAVGVGLPGLDPGAGEAHIHVALDRFRAYAACAVATRGNAAAIVDVDRALFGADDDAVGAFGIGAAIDSDRASARDRHIACTAGDNENAARPGDVAIQADDERPVVRDVDIALRGGRCAVDVNGVRVRPAGGDGALVHQRDVAAVGDGA